MVFSDTTNLQGIVQDIDFNCNTDVNSYPLTHKTRNINERFRVVWSWIFESYGGWIWDDSNQTDLPQATTGLTSSQGLYAVPTGTLSVQGVEVLTTGNVWQKLVPITAEIIRQRDSMGDYLVTPGQPLYYRLIGESIQLYPAPNYTQASSLKVFFSRDISAFVPGDTTKTPGFASPFHRVLSVGASIDYCKAKQLAQLQGLLLEWADFEKRIKAFYSSRYEEMFPARMFQYDIYREFK